MAFSFQRSRYKGDIGWQLKVALYTMSSKKNIAACVLGIMSVLFMGGEVVIAQDYTEAPSIINPIQTEKETQVSAYEALTHQQRVWVSALEWCESKGKYDSINPRDSDNTPSYYSFQFKPSTFKQYGEKYGVIAKGLSDDTIMELIKEHELQREIVAYMINDRTVNLQRQFPMCSKKLSLPSRFFTKQVAAASTSTDSTKVAITKK